MAISSNIYRTRDLNEPTTIEHLPHVLAMGDDKGDQFDIAVTRGSVPVALDVGACTGWFIRLEENKKIEDCQTVILTGSVSSNVASVILPESCYVTNGRFILTIFATLEGRRHAVYIGEGMVARTYTDTLVDPGKNIPDISELLAKLGEMETARSNAQNAANAATTAAGSANTAAGAANTAASKANTEASKLANATFSATKLAPDANPTVTRTEVSGHYNYNYGIPQGATGAVGPAGPQGTAGATGPQGPQGLKGDAGAAAGFGKITASVDESVGTPSVEVTASGDDTAKNLDFKFHNLKGVPGEGAVSTVYGVQPDDTGDVRPEVGGRNLLLKSSQNISSYKYQLARYALSPSGKELKVGDNVVVSGSVDLAAEVDRIDIFRDGGYRTIGHIKKEDIINGKFILRGTWVEQSPAALADYTLSIYIWPRPDNDTAENPSSVSFVKLERGVVPTDWTPAPEDLESATGNAYTPSNPPPYPVTSVNGYTGATIGTSSINFPDHCDFNQLTKEGIYSLYKTYDNYTNGPERSYFTRGVCYVGRWNSYGAGNNSWVIQVLIATTYHEAGESTGSIYVRSYHNFGWTKWTTFYSDGYNNPPYPVTSVNNITGAAKVVGSVWGAKPGDDYDAKPEIGGRNLFASYPNKKLSPFSGSAISFEENVSVSEWGATDAIRAYGASGTNTTFATLNDAGGKLQPNRSYVHSIYIKNNSIDKDIIVTNNLNIRDTVKPGEAKRIVLMGAVDDGEADRQFTFVTPAAGDAFDFVYWHPKIEFGVVPTDWTPAPELYADRQHINTQQNTGLFGIMVNAYPGAYTNGVANAFDAGFYTSGNPRPYMTLRKLTGDLIVHYLYSDNNPPPYPVSSVNNKTGAVSITAENIQAVRGYANDEADQTEIQFISPKQSTFDRFTLKLRLDGTKALTVNHKKVSASNYDSYKLYNDKTPPPYPVTSVNGKTGAVTLDAAAVGARPSNWSPFVTYSGTVTSETNETIHLEKSQISNFSADTFVSLFVKQQGRATWYQCDSFNAELTPPAFFFKSGAFVSSQTLDWKMVCIA